MMSTDAGFSETSSSDYEWGLTIGGETGFELIDEGSYDVNVSITEEGITSFNGYLTGFALEEIYIDYSEDEEEGDPEQTGGSQEERPERVHRLTHTHITGADRTDEIIFETTPAGAVPTDPNAGQEEESTDDLLNSYQAQVEQLIRLQALLAQTDDPQDRAWLEGLIAAQQDAVANAAEAATAAGVTADQLATAADAAQDAVDADPPTWTSPGDLGDDDITSGAPGYWHFLTNPSDMDEGWLQNTQYAALWTAAIAGGLATGGTIYEGSLIAAMPTFTYWGATAIISTVSTAQPVLVSAATTLTGSATLVWKVPNTVWVRVSRFFATSTSYESVRNSSSVFRFLRNQFPGLNFQMHHWFIANSTAGSNGLSNVGNAGWNLFPIPGVWNNFVGNGGAFFALTRIGIGVGAPTAVGGATYGTYTASDSFWEWMFGNGASGDTEQ